MPETERGKILSRKKLFFYRDPSCVDKELLREELTRCRALGYSQDIGNITPGVNVISAPLFANHEKLIGCLILIGTFPEKRIEEYGPKVADMAFHISQKLGADVETIYPKQSSHTGK
jgi:DNA-binding IclR family transcriptional regulator